MSGLLRHIDRCQSADPARYRRLLIGDAAVGFVMPRLWKALDGESALQPAPGGWRIDPSLDTLESRSAALAAIVDRLIAVGLLPPLRRELYPLIAHYGAAPLALIDRTAVSAFGVIGVGLHLNGYVRGPDGIQIWIGERAQHLRVNPGQLDNLVAGGLPWQLTLAENLAKEAYEEAGMPADLIAGAIPTGVLSYATDLGDGMRRDVLFVYDIELSPSFRPESQDGEVAAFHLMPADAVLALVETTDRVKWNCNLVLIDFMIRHGLISPDHPDYLALSLGLRRPHPV